MQGNSIIFRKDSAHVDLNSDDPTLSVFVRLSGIGESASKEYGAITLDVLLRAGVLVEGDNGRWDLTPDYSERHIYLVGNAKTVENMVTIVCDIQDQHITCSDASI